MMETILEHSHHGIIIKRPISFMGGSFMISDDENGRYFPYQCEVVGNIYRYRPRPKTNRYIYALRMDSAYTCRIQIRAYTPA